MKNQKTIIVVLVIVAVLVISYFVFFRKKEKQTKLLRDLNTGKVYEVNLTDNTKAWITSMPVLLRLGYTEEMIQNDTTNELSQYTTIADIY